jgi:hypothetical protein
MSFINIHIQDKIKNLFDNFEILFKIISLSLFLLLIGNMYFYLSLILF